MLRVLSLFSGIGAFEKALENIGVDYELVGYCEIDPYAAKSYALIHGVSEDMNLKDVTKVDTSCLHDVDLVTYGFPCQDLSVAGKQKGFEDEEGKTTRSGLFFEALRIIEDTKPKYAIAENVKNLMSDKFDKEFSIVIDSLWKAGYNSYVKVLNSKDFGVPQNRERVFIVSIRKDIDDYSFVFPKEQPLEIRLKDILEESVDKKYYLKNYDDFLIRYSDEHRSLFNDINVACDDTTRIYDAKDNYLQWDTSGKGYNSQQDRAYYQDGLCPTLSSSNEGGTKSQVVLMDKAEIMAISIPQTVKVRKYPVDTEGLRDLLRSAKVDADLRNNDIAEALCLPITKVEHWFRRDDSFAIPDSEVWFDLKDILHIETDEFDESIMEFEEKDGIYEKSERHYFAEGLAPTLTSTSAAEKIIVNEPFIVASRGRNPENSADCTKGCNTVQRLEPNFDGVSNTLTTVLKDNYVAEPKIIKGGNIYPSGGQNDNVYNPDGIAPTLSSETTETESNGGIGSNNSPKIVEANCPKESCESDDGNDAGIIYVGNLNPSGRGQNGKVIDSKGLARTITIEKGEGQKILVREATKIGYAEAYEGDSINFEQPNSKTRIGRVGHDVAQTITTSPQQGAVVNDSYRLRIRKLTPKECFRLMGFDDKDLDILVENGISNTQLYKMAGNSIVVDVLEKLFESLLLKKVDREPDLFSMLGL